MFSQIKNNNLFTCSTNNNYIIEGFETTSTTIAFSIRNKKDLDAFVDFYTSSVRRFSDYISDSIFPPQMRNEVHPITVSDQNINNAPNDFYRTIINKLNEDNRNGGKIILNFFHIVNFIKMLGDDINKVLDKAVTDKIESKIECNNNCPIFEVMKPVIDDIKNMLTIHKSKTVPLKDLVADTLKTINNRIMKIVQAEVFGDIVNNKYAKMFSGPSIQQNTQQVVQQVPKAPQPPIPNTPEPQPPVPQPQSPEPPVGQPQPPVGQPQPKQYDVNNTVHPNMPTFGGSVFMNGRKIEISCRMTGN